MAQIILMAVGFAALLTWSSRLFWEMRKEAHESVQSHLPAMGFGVGLMGLVFLGSQLYYNTYTFPVSLAGMMWIAILQGLASCIVVQREWRNRT